MDGTPRLVVNVVDPGNWSFNSDVGTTVTGTTGRPDPDVGSGDETADPDPAQTDDAARAREREAPRIPKHAPSAAQDRSAVAGVDLFHVFFTELPMIERIPTAYWEQWARANAVVYEWVLSSEPGTEQYDNTLFWELFLHKMLLRKSPKSRGRGRATKDIMDARFRAFTISDYQFLVHGLVKACNAARRRKRTHVHGQRRG